MKGWIGIGHASSPPARRRRARWPRRSGAGRAIGRRQRGATLAEFVVVAPVLLGIGGGTVQAGLAYHGKTVLNYATFEAARAGAVHHALMDEMEAELGTRLAPLQGGDGTVASAVEAIARSKASLGPSLTRVRILNPTAEAFDRWKVRSKESGREVIPNSHLRHRDGEQRAGVTLQDANLLKIEVVHGFDLKVPLVGSLLTTALAAIDPDPERLPYYAAGLLPLRSVATVRMQSEVWGDDVATAAGTAPGGAAADAFVDGGPPTDAAEPVPTSTGVPDAEVPAGDGFDLDALLGGEELPNAGLPLVSQDCGVSQVPGLP